MKKLGINTKWLAATILLSGILSGNVVHAQMMGTPVDDPNQPLSPRSVSPEVRLDDQVGHLVMTFYDEYANKNKSVSSLWKNLVDHCQLGQGELGAEVAHSESRPPAIRFTCKDGGEIFSTPWYIERFGRDFYIEEYGGDVALFDGTSARYGTMPFSYRYDDLAGSSYGSSIQSIKGNVAAIVSPETIKEALREWVDSAVHDEVISKKWIDQAISKGCSAAKKAASDDVSNLPGTGIDQ